MLVPRLWLRGLSRRSPQKPRFLSHLRTTHSISPSHRHGFSGSVNLRDGLHRFLLSSLGEVFSAARDPGPCYISPSCTADTRRCFCTSEAQIVEGDVESAALQSGDHWEELIKLHLQNHAVSERRTPLLQENFACMSTAACTSAEGCDDLDSHGTGVIAVMGDKDAQNLSPFSSDYVQEECMDDSDIEDGGVGSKDINVFTSQDKSNSKTICKILNSKGWTESTKEILEKQCSVHLPHAVISAVIQQQKNVSLASSLFQWACERMGHNSRIYHAYLVKLGETKHFDEMWNLLTKMKESDLEVTERTLCMVIRACGVVDAPAMAVHVFERAHEYGIVVDIHLHRALLTMFFESNLVEEARLFYNYIVREGFAFDTHMFNTLIDGFNLVSATEDAKRAFETMLKEGFEPNIMSYNGLIEAYCNVNAIEKALSAFTDLQRKGLKPTATTVNLLLVAYCKMGRLDDVISLFTSMSNFFTPNRSTFNILLNGLFTGKQLPKAISLFLLMEKQGLANRMTYIYLSTGLRESPQTERVWQLLNDLFAKYGYAIKEVCVALLHNLSCRGRLNEAESLFKGMLKSSHEFYVPAVAIMISLYCRLKMPEKAFELLMDLKEKGQRPSIFCYTPIIAALLKVNRVVDAFKCFQEMLEQKYEVTDITCDFLLRELCKQGMIENALCVLSIMMSKGYGILKPTLKELMKCLCKADKIEEANSCFRALHKLGCLPIKKEAALQAIRVMDVMGCSANEKERMPKCVPS